MPKTLVILAGFIAALWISTETAYAEQGARHDAPDITGTWRLVAGEVIDWKGGTRDHSGVKGELVIDKQTGGVFHGEMTWDNTGAAAAAEFNDGQTLSSVVKNEVLGVIDWDGERVVIVDRDKDTSIYEGRLVNRHTLQMIGFEPGEHAFATRIVFIRD